MENKIQLRIVKQSIIAEIHWMFQIEQLDYFQAVLHSIQFDEHFVSTSLSIDQKSYDSFINNLNKRKAPHSFYQNACKSIQSITGFNEIRIWTKKECQEIYEILLECNNQSAQAFFYPLLKDMNNNEVLLIYQTFK